MYKNFPVLILRFVCLVFEPNPMFSCKANKGKHYFCFNVLPANVLGSELLGLHTALKKVITF